MPVKLPTPYQKFIYKRTYSRFLHDQNRRESFDESVQRYHDFFVPRIPEQWLDEWKEATDAILKLEVMPSMRVLWTAGEALDRENLAGFNCAYLAVNRKEVFSEALYVLMNGTGLGFSVERQNVNQLPEVPKELVETNEVIVIEDSKEGWAAAFRTYLERLYDGEIPTLDYSKIRPQGSILKIFGGRASGPEPLKELMQFVRRTFESAKGRKLNSLECHDIMCYIAKIVVVGGVRRSACISLSNRSDDRMAKAKIGQFWNVAAHRSLANNSIAYTEKPNSEEFMADWLNLIRSKCGERGIFNRESAEFVVRRTGRRKVVPGLACNPCSEIILRDSEVCNLSEVVVRYNDTLDTLKEKVRKATILGTIQSTLDKYQFVSDEWRKNIVEERLLGVSLTGLRDHPVLGRTSDEARVWLTAMKQEAIDTARIWSERLGINMPAAITCCKPSGTVSQLVDSSSGIHPRFSKYYIRRIRVSTVDPIFQMLSDKGLPWEPEVGESRESCRTAVFAFPIASPDTSVMNADVTALEQLEYWKMIQKYWCEHKPSVTVFVKDSEWLAAGAWVYENWKWVSGISFLPFDGGIYPLAPYEAIDEKTYNEMKASMPEIDFEDLPRWEKIDMTTGSREFACQGGACEL